MGWFDEEDGNAALKVWGGEGRGEASLGGWRREGSLSLSLSFSAYLAALKGVMEAVRGGYIIIIIITGSDKYGFPLQRTDGQFTKSKQHFFPYKNFNRLEKRFSSRVSQVTEGGRGKPAYWTR